VHNCGRNGPVAAPVSSKCQSSTGFAFKPPKPPLTMRMLAASAFPEIGYRY
jgi:hypothetical protein